MKKLLIVLSLLGAGTYLSACSPYRVIQNQSDHSANWSAYRSFAFIDTNRIDPTPRAAYQAVAAELKNRGYYPTRNNPDLLVNIGAVVKEKTQTRQTTIREAPLYTGQRRYHWQSQEVPVNTYQEGTINLHVVDAQRNALLWDVAVSSVLNQRQVTPAEVGRAVAKAFEKFPAKPSY